MHLLIKAGADLTVRNRLNETPLNKWRKTGGISTELPHPSSYMAWTPHRMLPRWTLSAFPKYVEECSGFRDAIRTVLLCLRRYRHLIDKGVGLQIVQYVAEMHRKQMWWPAWENFDMKEYM